MDGIAVLRALRTSLAEEKAWQRGLAVASCSQLSGSLRILGFQKLWALRSRAVCGTARSLQGSSWCHVADLCTDTIGLLETIESFFSSNLLRKPEDLRRTQDSRSCLMLEHDSKVNYLLICHPFESTPDPCRPGRVYLKAACTSLTYGLGYGRASYRSSIGRLQ